MTIRLVGQAFVVALVLVGLLAVSEVEASDSCVIDSFSYSKDTKASFEGQNFELVDAASTSLSCIDARYDHGVLGTPGGDSGEFLVALAALDKLLQTTMTQQLDAQNVEQYFRVFLAHLELQFPTRRFYLHTDEKASKKLFEQLGINATDASDSNKAVFDMSHITADKQPRALELLQQPDYTGCGHLRLLLEHPDQYQLREELTKAFIRVYYKSLWRQAASNDTNLHHKTDELIVLQGEQKAKCVWQVSSKSTSAVCDGLEPLVSPLTKQSSCFIHHVTATKPMRDALAVMLYDLAGEPSGFSVEQLRAEIDSVAAAQLALTRGYLATDLPINQAETLIKPSSEFMSSLPWILVGSALVLIGAALVVVAVFAARKSKPRTSYEQARDLELSDH